MSGPHDSPALLTEALAAILKPIVREAVQEAINGHREEDRLLDAEQASKMLRFSYQGIQKYLATRKIS